MTTKLVLGLSLFVIPALADTMSLYNWGFNVDGTIIDKANTPPLPSGPPVGINGGSFNFGEGLGTLTIVVTGPGTHYVDIYLDHDLNPANFAADNSAAAGTPAAGESWEIGEGAEVGGTQLYTDFLANNYDDTDNAAEPDDAATGLGFAFTTTADDPLGVITINVGETAPASGFYLHQFNDSASPTDIYISASEVNASAPEPATWLLCFPAAGVFVRRWRRPRGLRRFGST